MRCTNCGLPLSPSRAQSNCPRCGFALSSGQEVEQLPFDQPSWGAMGATPQHYNPWGQQTSTPPYQQSFNQQWPQNQFGAMPGQLSETPAPGTLRSGFPQANMARRRPIPPAPKKTNAGLRVALVGLIVATIVLGLVAALGLSGLGKSPANQSNAPTTTTTQQASASPTATSAPSATANATATGTGTTTPGQTFVDSAQMMTGPDPTTAQPASSFIVGSKMYVTFKVHPQSQAGEVCIYWYLNGQALQGANATVDVHAGSASHTSYAWSVYSNAGSAYVELYWANDATCANQVLAQHVDFTVTNS